MDIRLENSDIFITDSGSYSFLQGLDEVIQKALIAAKINKGSFVYNKTLGTDLRSLDVNSSNILQTAEVLINEAVAETAGVKLKVLSVEAEDSGMKLKIKALNATDEITEVIYIADL